MTAESFFPPEYVSMLYNPPIPVEFDTKAYGVKIYGYKHLGDLVVRLQENFEENGLPTMIECAQTTEFGIEAIRHILAKQGKELYFDESKEYAMIVQA